MYWLCVTLLVIGVLAIMLELLMSGSDGFISGIIGILALVASAVVAFFTIPFAWIFIAINLSVLGVACGFFFSLMRKKQIHGKIILSENLIETLPDVDYQGLLHKEGKTATILRPYGEADFNGIRVEVSSGGAVIEVGTRVKVVDVQASKVVVEPIGKN